jgi:hypothetical protein
MVVAAVLISALIVIPSAAHNAIAVDEAFPSSTDALELESIDVSQVAYATLERGTQLWLTFRVDAPRTLRLSLGVPVIDRLSGFRPALFVLGATMAPIGLPFDVPQGFGGVEFPTAGRPTPTPFHEPFTRTNSWILLEETVALPAAGQYYVVAHPAGETSGKLWVAVGDRERFGLFDILRFPVTARRVQAFHEIDHQPLARTWEALLVAAILGGILSWIVWVTAL